jgi:pimeloyl-ACP methyl ester carboxylesterase
MIAIKKADDTFRVWTRRFGNNPRIKVLLLAGGPGMSHSYLEAFNSWFPCAGIQFYYYDQLGTGASKQLKEITVPALMIGARYGTMNPKYMKWMAGQVQYGHFLYCPRGSHLCMYDEQELYMTGIIKFIEDVNNGIMPDKPNVN